MSCKIVRPTPSLPHRQRDFHTTTQEAQKSAYQNRAAKSREKYQQELAAYNANKKAAAKADSAAPAAEAAPKKRKKSKSEDGGEKKKVAFRRDDWSLQIYVYNSQGGLFMRYTARFHGVPFRTAKKEQEEGQGHGVRSCVSGRRMRCVSWVFRER